LKTAPRRSDRKRNYTNIKEPESEEEVSDEDEDGEERSASESENEDDGSTDKPTREILAWVRSMSGEDQRKHVTPGLRVKVRFSNNIWYGGVIQNVVKRVGCFVN